MGITGSGHCRLAMLANALRQQFVGHRQKIKVIDLAFFANHEEPPMDFSQLAFIEEPPKPKPFPLQIL
ncbi:hypothetical protein D3C84_708700 [compost metagenome]